MWNRDDGDTFPLAGCMCLLQPAGVGRPRACPRNSIGPIHRWDLPEEEATDVLPSNAFCRRTRIWWSEGPPLLYWRRALGHGPDTRGGEEPDSAAGAGLWRQLRERPVVEWADRQVSGRPLSHWWKGSVVGARLTLCRQYGENLFHVLPPFHYIRCFNFVKQMYLDIF
jgi:hypothetical protein